MADPAFPTTLNLPCLHLHLASSHTYIFRKLTQTLSTAYWIAFGPHGPRAQDPPGTGAKVAWGVALGLAASFGLFAVIRMFANPAPYTMTKEYQEQSNEFLIVSPSHLLLNSTTTNSPRTKNPILSPVSPPPATRAPVWFSRLPARTKAKHHTLFFLCARKQEWTRGLCISSMRKMDLESNRCVGGEEGDSRNQMSAWCKYCTTTTERESLFEVSLLDVFQYLIISIVPVACC
jgi:hypothetical protein